MKNLEAEVYYTALGADFDFYFIAQDSLYNRDGLYGTCYGDFQDNAERFIFFSRAVVEMVEALEMEFDVCRCLRYGTVPVVRAVGGLDETIQEYNPETGKGNGFKFSGYTPDEFMGAVEFESEALVGEPDEAIVEAAQKSRKDPS